MFDRRLVENFDWGFVLLILAISIAGLVVLYSALTAGHDAGVVHILFKKQIIWMVSGFIIMIIALSITSLARSKVRMAQELDNRALAFCKVKSAYSQVLYNFLYFQRRL